ncbi:hypothetical protein Aph02nite_53350 [Actinoplanes philippinensis]|uniref:AAA ATPase domain-containing protein n=1 Tax=Actinoplanes philippinensis TaxID=35752 RepID=A0A1I2IGF7_9ACTN|nr:ATP-binding protein [Actinoplanes philippinensis]GIE79385.1 hypothetical protein Aph02nite_53350 [Actinoplanes philippinensis]SFF41472.1 AAA ATPase domain-containing protein [Actinoplanes philippinensis]
MTDNTYAEVATSILSEVGIEPLDIDLRDFPGERWLIIFVPEGSVMAAQSLAGSLERRLNENAPDEAPFAVTFRPKVTPPERVDNPTEGGPLSQPLITQLIELLEARSRTSDALPSLKYVEDPRASLGAVAASRHQLIYGRRGVGKTALLLEAKRLAERSGHVAVWMNAQSLRHLSAATAFAVVAEFVVRALVQHSGSSESEIVARLAREGEDFQRLHREGGSAGDIGARLPALNLALRSVLREGVVRLYLYLDDFYLLPRSIQPALLDYLAAMLRDCDGWMKVASIERLTRSYEPSSHTGIEIPHDASKIDLDVTLENPGSAQRFLENVLGNYITAAGIKSLPSIAKSEALARLVIASGGVPRDYLNLFASSIVFARSRSRAREVGREDVQKAAGDAARSKKRDLEQDVSSNDADALLGALERLSAFVKGEGYTYFRVNMADKGHSGYELLSQLVNLRFVHLVQASLSDQHRVGMRYEAYVLDLSEYAEVRIKRSLSILDLEGGEWTRRQTGRRGKPERLTGTKFRDTLRQSPLIAMEMLSDSAI